MVSLRDIITILIIEEEEVEEDTLRMVVNETFTLIILLEVQMEARDSVDGVVDNWKNCAAVLLTSYREEAAFNF